LPGVINGQAVGDGFETAERLFKNQLGRYPEAGCNLVDDSDADSFPMLLEGQHAESHIEINGCAITPGHKVGFDGTARDHGNTFLAATGSVFKRMDE